jgi:hypothetical protein
MLEPMYLFVQDSLQLSADRQQQLVEIQPITFTLGLLQQV